MWGEAAPTPAVPADPSLSRQEPRAYLTTIAFVQNQQPRQRKQHWLFFNHCWPNFL